VKALFNVNLVLSLLALETVLIAAFLFFVVTMKALFQLNVIVLLLTFRAFCVLRWLNSRLPLLFISCIPFIKDQFSYLIIGKRANLAGIGAYIVDVEFVDKCALLADPFIFF
jgi:hypothetical protein